MADCKHCNSPLPPHGLRPPHLHQTAETLDVRGTRRSPLAHPAAPPLHLCLTKYDLASGHEQLLFLVHDPFQHQHGISRRAHATLPLPSHIIDTHYDRQIFPTSSGTENLHRINAQSLSPATPSPTPKNIRTLSVFLGVTADAKRSSHSRPLPPPPPPTGYDRTAACSSLRVCRASPTTLGVPPATCTPTSFPRKWKHRFCAIPRNEVGAALKLIQL